MNVREFREKLQIPQDSVLFSEIDIMNMIGKGSQTVDFYLETIKDCVILYEANRKIGDIETMNYYKNKMLGKLGMVR